VDWLSLGDGLAPSDEHVKPSSMSNEQTKQILQRIQAAIARIEALSDTPASHGDDASGEALRALEARHAMLRKEAAQALSALDSVISKAAGGSR
jgi:hypothetical protein